MAKKKRVPTERCSTCHRPIYEKSLNSNDECLKCYKERSSDGIVAHQADGARRLEEAKGLDAGSNKPAVRAEQQAKPDNTRDVKH